MNVLMMNIEFPPLGGGAANACYHMLREFAEKDVRMDLVTSNIEDRFEEVRFSKGIRVFKLPIKRKNIHVWRNSEVIRFTVLARRCIKRLMKERQYHVIHAFFGVPSGWVVKGLGVPYIVSLRGTDVPGYNLRYRNEYMLLAPIVRSVWSNAAFVVANSSGLKDLALQFMPGQRIEVIENGVDMGPFTPSGLDGKGLSVLCVSRLVERKGIRYLIEAMKRLRGKDISLTIIGEGDQMVSLKELVKKDRLEGTVDLLGYKEYGELPGYYGDSDVFVLPSLNEGMSNTVLEAMASGLAIVTTDTGGTKELIDGNGIVVEKRDPVAIAKALEGLYKDRKALKAMGDRSLEIASNMTWGSVTDRYLTLYEKAKARGTRRHG